MDFYQNRIKNLFYDGFMFLEGDTCWSLDYTFYDFVSQILVEVFAFLGDIHCSKLIHMVFTDAANNFR